MGLSITRLFQKAQPRNARTGDVREGIVLRTAETATLNIALDVGALEESARFRIDARRESGKVYRCSANAKSNRCVALAMCDRERSARAGFARSSPPPLT